MQEKYMSVIEHLEELRKVLIISIISLVPTSVIGWIYREKILSIILQPATQKGVKLVYLTPTEPFFVALKIAIFTGLILALPVILWQVWRFIVPALRVKERRLMILILPTSILLFVGGVVFGYFTVFKFGINFFVEFAQGFVKGSEPTFKLSEYLSFAISFLLPFGAIFEIPLLVLVLARLGIITSRFLASKRKYAVLIIFVLAAIITPTPDVFTQTMVAGPMYILYEISILIAYLVGRSKKKQGRIAEAEAAGNKETD